MSAARRPRRLEDNLVAVALLIVFGGVIWLCQDFGPRARMIPLPLAVFGIVLTLIQLVWQNLRSTDDLQMDLIAVAQRTAHGGENALKAATDARKEARRELRAYGIVALLVVLILLIGIIPAVFVFTAGYFVMTRQYSWRMGVVYTASFTAAVYLLFIAALQIQPYHGLLAPLIEHFR